MPTPPDSDHAARLARHAAAVQAETAAPVVFPQIGLNGSSPVVLSEGYAMAAEAVDAAISAALRTAPNARDYPDNDARHRAAVDNHHQRLVLLVKVRDELDALRRHCRAATRERTG